MTQPKTGPTGLDDAGAAMPRRLFVYTGGFLRDRRLRRILSLAGHRLCVGLPGPGDGVAVWGRSPHAWRGEAVAERRSVPVIRVEDAFLRSLHPGRAGEPPLGLLIDRRGVHFDARTPSDLETLLSEHPLDDGALLARARGCIARIAEARLTKYAATRTDLEPPAPGYVLVIDQTRGDASLACCGADRARFLEMLTFARQENPGARILVRTHPETARGFRPGHFRPDDLAEGITFHDAPLPPQDLLDGAVAVYTVSSQMGFEAILAGHRPHVFGTPFYAGWGLTEDRMPLPRRTRRLSRTQLFAGAMMLYPHWYDPCRDRLCRLEDAIGLLEARTRAWREDRRGWVASGMRLWKRSALQGFFGAPHRVRFIEDGPRAEALAVASGRRRMAWGRAPPGIVSVEDGFLRSRGLGAELVEPLSLVLDDHGIYYDPASPSALEHTIHRRASLRLDQIERIDWIIAEIRRQGLSKYNLSGDLPTMPKGHRILVPGQVEDDASIRLGSPRITRNADLLARVRAENPDAVILWKPHPDVEAGLRPGAVPDATRWADAVLEHAPVAPLLDSVDAVWTLTSLTGFEALLRGVPVTTLGAPFYAGWGLTRDLGPVPARRRAGPRPSLQGLVHATLIDYPRYRDPVSGLPCPVEVVLNRLAAGRDPRRGLPLRALSKLQGLFASRADLWRRP